MIDTQNPEEHFSLIISYQGDTLVAKAICLFFFSLLIKMLERKEKGKKKCS
jgi:hypothetical protein